MVSPQQHPAESVSPTLYALLRIGRCVKGVSSSSSEVIRPAGETRGRRCCLIKSSPRSMPEPVAAAAGRAHFWEAP